MFIDKAKVFVKSGKGGNGSVSFRREKYIPAGGPDGGDGGKGGNVILKVDKNIRTLMDYKYKTKYSAQKGEDGRGKKQFGKNGSDLILKVPQGTLIRDEETGYIIADLVENNQEFVVARGGRGGRGNVNFTTSTRQAPNFAEAGNEAEERWITLELKLLADVGLIGFPNVGKSTLLSVLTSANPKIGNYHFTTIKPNLGVVKYKDTNFVLADIPGLIEGAHTGAGLGLDFLKHIERTKLLVHVVDISGIEGRDPVDDFEKINEELKQYSNKLLDKTQIIAANKVDILSDMSIFEDFKEKMEEKNYKVFPISAATQKGIDELIQYTVKELVNIEENYEYFDEQIHEIQRYDPEEYRKITVSRDNDIYLVEGRQLKKIFDSTNFNDMESLKYFQNYLEKQGVIKELKEQGINEGDTVKIFDFEFEYYE